MSNTKVIITFEAKSDLSSQFHALLKQVKRDLPSVPGCTGVRLFVACENPCIFTLIEDWQSVSAHKAHINAVIASGDWKTIAAYLCCDPVSHYYNEEK